MVLTLDRLDEESVRPDGYFLPWQLGANPEVVLGVGLELVDVWKEVLAGIKRLEWLVPPTLGILHLEADIALLFVLDLEDNRLRVTLHCLKCWCFRLKF